MNIWLCSVDKDKDLRESLMSNIQNLVGVKLNPEIPDLVIVILTVNSNTDNNFLADVKYYIDMGKRNDGVPIVLPALFDISFQKVDDIFRRLSFIVMNYKYNTVQLNELINVIKYYEGKLDIINNAISNEKKIEKITKKADDFVDRSINKLEKRESINKRNAYLCYIFAFVSLVISICFTFWKVGYFFNNSDLTLSIQIQMGLSSIIAITLIIALSKFTFMLGKNFMVESLRNFDRIHAIEFGRFFLSSFGNNAKWEEVERVFKDWNIDYGSSFKNQTNSDYDPELLKYTTELLKLVPHLNQKNNKN